jgi:hypothetical protein
MLASFVAVGVASALAGGTSTGFRSNVTVHLIPRCARPAGCLRPHVVRQMKDETSRIWSLLDVRIDWIDSMPNAAATDSAVDLTVLLEESVAPEPAWSAGRGLLLALIHQPDLPCGSGLIRLWVAQARRHTASIRLQGLPLESLPQALVDLFLARALGRALAHEIGHYLFGSAHTAHGLMRASFTPAELIEPITAARYGFDARDHQDLPSCRAVVGSVDGSK